MSFQSKLAACSILLACAALLTGCGETAEPTNEGAPEAISLLGDPLYPLAGNTDKLLENLAEAKARFDAAPDDEEAAIWYGRRLGYLQRYSEAIQVYTDALEKHPNSAKLLRHRGHRHISRRKFVSAIRDLSRAAELADSMEDEIEPDGIPNARNEPRSTLKFNIWYHLGLAYFLNGEFGQAYSAFGQCHGISKLNPDMLCAATHWYYVATQRIGLLEDADLLLDGFDLTLDVIENKDYLDLILFYRGHYTAEDVLEVSEPGQRATRGFGVAHYWKAKGETDKANDLFLEIVDEGHWPSFGMIACEAELTRIE